MRVRNTFLTAILVSIASTVGCLSLGDLDEDFTEAGATGGGAGAGAGAGGAPATSNGAGGSTCEPLSEAPCYDGPPGTQGVGICAEGTRTCNVQGTAYGECVGQTLPTMEDYATPNDDENCDGLKPCDGTPLWSLALGGLSNQIGSSVAVDQSSGNVFVTGSSEGSIEIGDDELPNGIFLAKFDSSGNPLWAKTFGPGATILKAGSVSLNANGDCVITGGYGGPMDFGDCGPLPIGGQRDAFLAVFDGETGNCTFSAGFGDGGDQFGTDAVLGDDGSTTLVGKFNGAVDFGGPTHTAGTGNEMFLARFAPNGAYLWSKSFAAGPDLHAHNIALAGDDVFVTGKVRGIVNFGGLCGEMLGDDADYGDTFVVKLDNTNGGCLWSKRFGDATPQAGQLQDAYGLAADADGNLVVAGNFEGSVQFDGSNQLTSAGGTDIFVLKLTSTGAYDWHRGFGDTGEQAATSASLGSNGDIAITGYFTSQFAFNPDPQLEHADETDVFVAKLSASGVPLWSKRFGVDDRQEAYGVALDPAGDVLVTGLFRMSIELDKTLTSIGAEDGFLAKLCR